MTDKPITEDPKALAEYLVTKALEAFDLRFGGTKSDRVFERAGFQTHVRERMNNAAQTITAEVEALRDDSLMWKDGLGHCRAALDGCVKERGAAVARAERAEALLAALREAAVSLWKLCNLDALGNEIRAAAKDCTFVLTDTAQAAEAYRASVEAPLRAEIRAMFEREAASLDDLEAVAGALGWMAGEYTYPGLAAGVTALRAEIERLREAADLREGECSHGAHGPWCREWTAMVTDRDEARAEIERLRAERDEASESLRLSVAAWDAAGMRGRDAASVIREAEERGARWALATFFGPESSALVDRSREATRICEAARKAGEHE